MLLILAKPKALRKWKLQSRTIAEKGSRQNTWSEGIFRFSLTSRISHAQLQQQPMQSLLIELPMHVLAPHRLLLRKSAGPRHRAIHSLMRCTACNVAITAVRTFAGASRQTCAPALWTPPFWFSFTFSALRRSRRSLRMASSLSQLAFLLSISCWAAPSASRLDMSHEVQEGTFSKGHAWESVQNRRRSCPTEWCSPMPWTLEPVIDQHGAPWLVCQTEWCSPMLWTLEPVIDQHGAPWLVSAGKEKWSFHGWSPQASHLFSASPLLAAGADYNVNSAPLCTQLPATRCKQTLRALVTSHPCFEYPALAFGLEHYNEQKAPSIHCGTKQQNCLFCSSFRFRRFRHFCGGLWSFVGSRWPLDAQPTHFPSSARSGTTSPMEPVRPKTEDDGKGGIQGAHGQHYTSPQDLKSGSRVPAQSQVGRTAPSAACRNSWNGFGWKIRKLISNTGELSALKSSGVLTCNERHPEASKPWCIPEGCFGLESTKLQLAGIGCSWPEAEEAIPQAKPQKQSSTSGAWLWILSKRSFKTLEQNFRHIGIFVKPCVEAKPLIKCSP